MQTYSTASFIVLFFFFFSDLFSAETIGSNEFSSPSHSVQVSIQLDSLCSSQSPVPPLSGSSSYHMNPRDIPVVPYIRTYNQVHRGDIPFPYSCHSDLHVLHTHKQEYIESYYRNDIRLPCDSAWQSTSSTHNCRLFPQTWCALHTLMEYKLSITQYNKAIRVQHCKADERGLDQIQFIHIGSAFPHQWFTSIVNKLGFISLTAHNSHPPVQNSAETASYRFVGRFYDTKVAIFPRFPPLLSVAPADFKVGTQVITRFCLQYLLSFVSQQETLGYKASVSQEEKKELAVKLFQKNPIQTINEFEHKIVKSLGEDSVNCKLKLQSACGLNEVAKEMKARELKAIRYSECFQVRGVDRISLKETTEEIRILLLHSGWYYVPPIKRDQPPKLPHGPVTDSSTGFINNPLYFDFIGIRYGTTDRIHHYHPLSYEPVIH
jgi:hypothetical protein